MPWQGKRTKPNTGEDTMIGNKILNASLVGAIALLSIALMSCAKGPLSETAAFSKIQSVPEIQSFIGKVNRDSIKPIIRQEGSAVNGNDLLEYYIGESHPTHDVLWNRFAINKKTSEIFVFDVESGDYIPLEEWRGKSR